MNLGVLHLRLDERSAQKIYKIAYTKTYPCEKVLINSQKILSIQSMMQRNVKYSSIYAWYSNSLQPKRDFESITLYISFSL